MTVNVAVHPAPVKGFSRVGSLTSAFRAWYFLCVEIPPTQEKAMPSRDIRRAQEEKGRNRLRRRSRNGTRLILCIYIGTVVVLVIVVVAFVLAGPGGPMSGGGGGAAATSYSAPTRAGTSPTTRGATSRRRGTGIANQVQATASQNTRAIRADGMVPGVHQYRGARGHSSQAERAGVNVSRRRGGQGAAQLSRLSGRQRRVQRGPLQGGYRGGQEATRKLTA